MASSHRCGSTRQGCFLNVNPGHGSGRALGGLTRIRVGKRFGVSAAARHDAAIAVQSANGVIVADQLQLRAIAAQSPHFHVDNSTDVFQMRRLRQRLQTS